MSQIPSALPRRWLLDIPGYACLTKKYLEEKNQILARGAFKSLKTQVGRCLEANLPDPVREALALDLSPAERDSLGALFP